MRVLLVVHGFPPHAWGGTEIYTHDLARSLRDDLDQEVFVLAREADSSRPEYALRSEDRNGIRVYLVNNTFRLCRSFEETYRNPTLRALAARVVDEVRPDVAHLQHLTCLSTEIVADLAARGIPIVFTLNDYWLMCHRGQLLDMGLERCEGPHYGCTACLPVEAAASPGIHALAPAVRSVSRTLGSRIASGVLRIAHAAAAATGSDQRARQELDARTRHMLRLARSVDLFLAPSRTLERRLVDFGVARERIRFVQQGIAHGPLSGLARTSSDHLRIGFLGSLMVSKAPHLLLEAFAGLAPNSATLEVYGGFADYHSDASYRERLRPLLELPGVNHHGPVPHDQVPAALASIDVLVVPSVWLENAPFVIREAFVAGVPVVTSDLGGMAEMVKHEVSGLRFRPGDAADLQRALQRLIDEPDLLARLRQGIPRMMTIAEDTAQLHALYAELVGHGAPRSRPRLAAVVLSYRSAPDCVLAVRSLESSARPVDDIVVVDNGSDDGSEELLRRHFPELTILQTGANLGFSGGCNVGIRHALERGAELVFLLNPDAMVAAETLGILETHLLAEPEVGIVGPLVLARSDPSQVASAGISFSRRSGRMRQLGAGEPLDPERHGATRQVAAVSGCAMLIRRAVLEQVGLLDEAYFFSFEDIDLCLRAAAKGWRSAVVGSATAYHQGSACIGSSSPERLYYAARNHLLVAGRAAPSGRLPALVRAASVLVLNLAHALTSPGASPHACVDAVLRGTCDFLVRRLGKGGRAH